MTGGISERIDIEFARDEEGENDADFDDGSRYRESLVIK